MRKYLPATPTILLLSTLLIGLFPQSAADPMMMAPFAVLSLFMILSGKLLKLPSNDIFLFLLMLLWTLWAVSGITAIVTFPPKVTWVIMGTLPLAYLVTRTSHDINPLRYLSLLILPFATYTLWQGTQGITRPDDPFDDSNLLGLLYAFGILSALPHTLPEQNKKARLIFASVAIILLTALILTQSRSAMITLICAGAVFIYLAKPIKAKISKEKLVIGAGLAGLLTLLCITTGFFERFTLITERGIDPSIIGRISIWKAAWDMSWVHPLTGLGLGTFHLHYPAYRMAGDNSLGWMVHMDTLQTAVECGWIAAITPYSIFIYAFYTAYKNRHILTPPQIGAATLITCMFVGMHMNYPMEVAPFLIITGTSFAILIPPTTPKPVPVITSCGLLATLLFGIWTITYTGMTLMLAEEVQKSYRLMDQPRFDKAMQACINDGDKDFPDCRIMAARFLTLAHDKNWQRTEKLLAEAEAANPLNPEPDYIRAERLMGLNPPQPDEAMTRLKHSLSLNPSYWPARRMTITILMQKDDKISARAVLDEGLIYRYSRRTVEDISRLRKELQ
jgi:O-antigen ligase